jgi:type VI secretion system VasD/TssJ family lipoprotein
MRVLGTVWCCALLFLLTACAGSAPAPEPNWARAEKGIELTFRADPQVNFYEGQPHTVTICVFQLGESSAFQKLLTYPSGVQKMLSANSDLPPSLASDRFYLEPGETSQKIYDRVEGAKWIVIVAGYFSAPPDKAAIMKKIDYEVERSWLFFDKKAVIPTFQETIHLDQDGLRIPQKP